MVSETMIFPRYHQLDAVTKLLVAARTEGPGHNYLIQHSAGSGKSNSIAWLAHRLASLHDAGDKAVFDSIIVVTDRRVLDQQLQDTIFQFDHKAGLIAHITGHDEGSKSAELAKALEGGTRIVIVTLQTFPFVMALIENLKAKTFAIIADEAHSSQTGRASEGLKQVLAPTSLDDAEGADAEAGEADTEDLVLKTMKAKGPQTNLSFFAFTATPKKRTKEMFGRPGPDGKAREFHLYSMRQAIEEGFILDVLRNYTTYNMFYRVSKQIDEDPKVDTAKARRALAQFVSLHPHNLAQKTRVMVEHFRHATRRKIGGRAKAMVVTRSRLHAVRYRKEFERYIKERGYDDIKVLVAFSGTVIDPDSKAEFTEPGMNAFGERELPERFGSDDYQLLIVAEKYQTGFDQPLLHTMYVDKKLHGLRAVQTLSRLNRIHARKEDTFILDFENSDDEIREAFAPYYEQSEIDEPTDFNQIYTVQTRLEEFHYYQWSEVEGLAGDYFLKGGEIDDKEQAKLHRWIDPAVDRFKAEEDDNRREEYRALLVQYIRFYSFVVQMVPLEDTELEKLYVFARFLRNKLPRRQAGSPLDLDGDVGLAFYRLEKRFEGDASVTGDEDDKLTGPKAIATGRPKDEHLVPLSEIIQVLNERFGMALTDEDALLGEQMKGDLHKDRKLEEQARNNDIDQFRHVFRPRALDAFAQRTERNARVSSDLMRNKDARDYFFEALMHRFYKDARSQESRPLG